jgi:hypothetical protein
MVESPYIAIIIKSLLVPILKKFRSYLSVLVKKMIYKGFSLFNITESMMILTNTLFVSFVYFVSFVVKIFLR